MCGLGQVLYFLKVTKAMQLWFVLKLSIAFDTLESNFSPQGNHTDTREDREVCKGNELLHAESGNLLAA